LRRRIATLLAVLAALAALAAPAAGQVTPRADMGVTLTEGTGVLELDLSIGLNAGAPGKTLALGTSLAADRYSGLSVSYGVLPELELGAAGAYTWSRNDVIGVHPRRPNWPRLAGTDERTLGPFHVYAKYRVMPFLALEGGLVVPGTHMSNDRVAIQVGLPFRHTVIPGVLAVHARPDLLLGFTKPGWSAGTDVQVSIYVDAGVTANFLPELWADVSLGYGRALDPTAATLNGRLGTGGLPEDGFLPVSVTLGYAVIPALEFFAGFTLTNLLPINGTSSTDGRALTLGMALHF